MYLRLISNRMNKKTLLILFGIFIVLGIAASYSWWGLYIGIAEKSYTDTELNFSAFTENTTNKIAITKSGEEEKTITKENGTWKVNGFSASQKEIEDFFSALSELSVESLVSKNSENHANFEVTEESGTMLVMEKDGLISTFIIGKRGATFSSFYIKTKKSDNVYEVSGTLKDKLSQSITAWRDKTIVNIPKERIQKIEIISKKDPLVITKSEAIWSAERLGKTAILDETTANRLLAALNPLEATSFLNEEEQKEFNETKDKTIIRVSGDGEKNLATINLFEKNNEWWGQVGEETVFYKIPSYKLSDIFLRDENIFKTK